MKRITVRRFKDERTGEERVEVRYGQHHTQVCEVPEDGRVDLTLDEVRVDVTHKREQQAAA